MKIVFFVQNCYPKISPDGIAERESAAPAASKHKPSVDAKVLPQFLNVSNQGLSASVKIVWLENLHQHLSVVFLKLSMWG